MRIACVCLMLVLAGCGAWNPFVQSEKSRETSEKLGVTHESALAKEEAPAFAPSAGQGSTQ
ncbi:MAG: hypothetical protein V2A58_17365, partial [Planctomycetota bacterium]